MRQSSTETTTLFTPCASLAALGCYLRHIQLFEPIRERVQIGQKTVKHAPIDKLYDAWIALLAGAHGLVEINTRLRSDRALQQAFGRTMCADQSTVQATLNACTTENVLQLQQALTTIYRHYSRGYRHDYARRMQLLDVDLTGMPCGRQAALSQKGYFATTRHRRGRQLGRVLATHYGEVIIDQVYGGKTSLASAFRALIEAAEQVLDLTETQRQRTIVRADSGGGSVDDINWALERGYHIHTKDYSRRRARKLGQSVQEWFDDPAIAGRQVGWVSSPATEYVRPVRRLAVRWQTKAHVWEYAVVISTLLPGTVLQETGRPLEEVLDHQAVTLAYVRFYDDRGGGVETAIKDDKQGLGLTKRNKKRFAAQQMLVLLGMLAHNVIVWARRWLAAHDPKMQLYGHKRMVRDIFHISGRLIRNARGQLVQIVLNQATPRVRAVVRSLDVLLRPIHLDVNWGEI
jgi:Transposase DDE domain group 1